MAQIEKVRILIADADNQLTRSLSRQVSQHGFDCKTVSTGPAALELMKTWKPKIVMADLMLPGINAFGLLERCQKSEELRHQIIHVIVMSGHNSAFNVKQSFEKGAKDYLVKPFKQEEVIKRLAFHCQKFRGLEDLDNSNLNQSKNEASLMLHLTDLVLRQANSAEDLEEKLFQLTRMVSLKVKGVRCSIVHVLDSQQGVVVTSNDDRKASGIRLNLEKYPEILGVVHRDRLVAIENIGENREMKMIQKVLKDIAFQSMIVCPVKQNSENFGVLSLRMPAEKKIITDNEIRFVEIVAHVASLLFSGNPNNQFWLEAAASRPIPFRRKPKS